MKHRTSPQKWLVTAVAGLALSAGAVFGAADYVIQSFDDGTSVTAASDGGQWPASTSGKSFAWSTQNASGGAAGSGALETTIYWTNTASGWNDAKVNFASPGAGDFAWPGIDCRPYINIEFDVKIDTANSSLGKDGHYGGIEVIFQGWENANGNPNTLGWVKIGSVSIDNTSAWQRKKLSVSSYPYNLNKLVFNFNLNNGGTNKITYLIDNITLTAPPAPPPTMSLVKAVPGLEMTALGSSEWDRQIIRTVNSNYTWLGASGPVSYSVDIAKLGDNANPSFCFFMHFIPGSADPGRNDSDWHETNCLMFRVENQANGGGWSSMRFKTNAPDNNGVFYSTGDLGGIGNAKVEGTWTVTFTDNATYTITTPSGGTFTTNLPPEVVSVFNSVSGMQVNYGIIPNAKSRIGLSGVITRAKLTGTPGGNIDSSFLGQGVDTNIWKVMSTPNAVQLIPTDAAWSVNWTLPDAGFKLQTRAAMGTGSWTESTNSTQIAGQVKKALFRQSELPSANSGYFSLMKRVASKLQILLPGETAAPGTPTGKTGTPVQPVIGEYYTITVRAVDSQWYPVNTVTDTIRITSNEGTATMPADAPLSSGTGDFMMMFYQSGTWSVTATDTVDATIAPGTASVTVPPPG